ncbi:MAG: DUF2508 family protein [Oscillospiraceae bacterium]|nr:DUF2508 family protein [Oscillospiraceae bacterium]
MGENSSFFRKSARESEEMRDLRMSLEETKQQIARVYGWFNYADDPDLIDSYVYEINALRARYNYLLRRVKDAGGEAVACGRGGDDKQWT